MDETADAPRIMTEHGRGTLTGEAARSAFRRSGYLCVEGALDPTFCRATIGTLAQASMVAVASQDLRGVTRFLTLNGEELLARAPRLEGLYEQFGRVVSFITGETLLPLDNRSVGLSLNYTHPGGGFVRHFDRNEMTVSLYLNTVDAGELLIWPNVVSPLLDVFGRYKLPLALRATRLRKPIDIPPRTGTAVVFSRRTAHAVSPVAGSRARVSVIMAFDRPGKSFQEVPDYYGRGAQRVVLDRVEA